MKRIIIFSLIFGSIAAKAQDARKFSFSEAITFAEQNNTTYKNAQLDVNIAKETVKQTTSYGLPQVSASAGYQQYLTIPGNWVNNFTKVPGSSAPDYIFIRFQQEFASSANLSVSQLLFDGTYFVGLQATKAFMGMSELLKAKSLKDLQLNVAKAYVTAVSTQKNLTVIEANIALLEKNARDTRILYENGFREKLDVDKTEVQLANLRTERNKVMNQVSNGYFGLKLLMGMPVRDELILTDTLVESFVLEGALDAEGYKYESRKEYQYAQIGKRLSEYNLRRYKLSQVPTFSMNAVYAKNAQRSTWNFFGRGDWFTIYNINLNLNIPIFNGFVTKSRIQQTRIDLRKTENQITALQLSIDREVSSAKNNFSSAIARLNTQKQTQTLAEQVYRQTKKKYEIGTGSQIEITVAQTDLKSAQTNYITALYDAVIAKIDYLQATGKLSQSL